MTLSLLAVLGGTPLDAVEAQVATPFEVRKEAQELFDDLKRRGATAGPEDGALLERIQQLMARHGDRLIEAPGARDTAMPLSEVLLNQVRDLGLAERFVATYAPLAKRRAAELHGNEPELLTLVRSYPGTPTALAVWRQLADRAWDSGRIGAFLERAAKAEDAAATVAGSAARRVRLNQARPLLVEPPGLLPMTLVGAE